jgi:hypothetical protein
MIRSAVLFPVFQGLRDLWSRVRRRPILVVALPLVYAMLLTACGRVFAAKPDVVSVAAMPYGGGTYRVSVIFPTVLRDGSGKAAIADLAKRSGWSPSDIQWVQMPALQQFPAASTVEFSVNTLYPRGNFPIEAIALAFKSWGGVDVTVAHDGRFQFNGQPHNENADATMDVSTGSNALNVFVRIKNPSIQSLQFTPLSAPPAPGAPAPAPRPVENVPVWIVMLIALPLAGLTGVAVYLYLDGKRNKPSLSTARGVSAPGKE